MNYEALFMRHIELFIFLGEMFPDSMHAFQSMCEKHSQYERALYFV